MKEGLWVKDVVVNGSSNGVFLAKEKKLLTGKTGKPYLLVRLMDRSGEVEARIWNRAEVLGGRFQTGDLIKIIGKAVTYQGTIQVKIEDVTGTHAMREEYFEDFVPGYLGARRDSEKRLEELLSIIQRIESEHLRTLVEMFIADESLRDGWLTTPAAKRLHHARFGGLLEHTLSVCKLADSICHHYPQLHRDILMAGAVIHDVGKIRELHSPWSPDYTTEGRLVGHVTIGLQMLEERLSGVESFPEEDALALKHLILSHHGELEFGSPRRPKTLEALALHVIDDLDAKYDAFHQHISSKRAPDEAWTTYHPLLDRYLYRGYLTAGVHREED